MGQAYGNLVLLPGSLCDERVWHNQVRELAASADILVPHLHGHNSLGSMADAVLAEAPSRFALAGFSMGGRVALEMVRRAPERVTRLALVDSSVHPIADGEAARRQPQIELAQREGMAAFARWWNPQIVPAALHDDTAFLGMLEAMAETFTPDQYEEEVQALLKRPDAREVLGRVSVPTLVLHGAQDILSNPERNRAIAEAIPGAKLVTIEGAGHFPMLEKPDEVTAALREWLAA